MLGSNKNFFFIKSFDESEYQQVVSSYCKCFHAMKCFTCNALHPMKSTLHSVDGTDFFGIEEDFLKISKLVYQWHGEPVPNGDHNKSLSPLPCSLHLAARLSLSILHDTAVLHNRSI